MNNILDDIVVLDFSRVFAGPAATQVLGDMGADVIKVEPPAGDEARYYGVTKEKLAELGGVSPSFLALNRNKRSITLDLRNEEGNRIARELADRADVVVHNFRPGVMERLGLGYETLAQTNKGLIYAEFTAYGGKGPLAHIGANDLALQAHSGLISITGEPDRPPVRCGTAIVDLHGSLAIAAGILGALLHRHKSGRGQRVESSLLLSSAHLMSYFYTEYWMDGTVRKPMGTANHLSVPNQAFPAKDGEVVIIASTDEMWTRLAHAIDPEKLDVPRFARVFDRRQNRVDLIDTLSSLTRELTCAEIVQRLGAAKVVVAKVNSVGEAADSLQLEAVGGKIMLDAGHRQFPSVASPFQFSEVDINKAKAPPQLGQHTREILGELGYDAEALESLTAAGAFGISQPAE
ncbi:CoA transferase [Chelativorans sp. AA-79]|uniref:CaiB/BaiF CoA transferase family protein n=1 Tax=Chelativorans sp. AA-79 TaxID=3028735 RepID=UPI0023F9BA00|nr:CoA transferase [Chelativorans sp. AA-79]WEX09048.1 CoA transferase [Chelativorans sp. AA-79]